MAVTKPAYLLNKEIKTIREARIYIRQLNINNCLEPLDIKHINYYKEQINSTLKKMENIKALIHSIDERLLPDNAFDWIKDNDRACNYVWGRILNLNTDSINNTKPSKLEYLIGLPINKSNNNTKTTYDELNLNKHPSNTNERFEIIINFFDFIDLPITNKQNLLNQIKESWKPILDNNKLKWLDSKNEGLCDWAWKYIKEYSDFCEYLHPICDNDKYLCFYAAFDLWSAGEDTKKLFKINITKAYSQRKFRTSIEHKKALNTFIDKESKTKLENLCKVNNMKINQMIEYLIESEFKRNK